MKLYQLCGIILMAIMALVAGSLFDSTQAGPRKAVSDASQSAGEADETPAQADVFLEDFALGDIVQVKGNEVWIRLTPGQFHSSKATSRVKRRGQIRIVLRPRQIRAMEKEIEGYRPVGDVILSVNSVDLRRSRLPKERFESHFVVKPVGDFK